MFFLMFLFFCVCEMINICRSTMDKEVVMKNMYELNNLVKPTDLRKHDY